MREESNTWNDYLKYSTVDKKFEECRKEFLVTFEKKWTDLFSDITFDLCQIDTGNRLRPQVTFFGYLANEKVFYPSKYDYIVNICTTIELIHKSSLLLDDLIDNDNLRNNQSTFHTVHGKNKTILFALNLTSKALINLSETLQVEKVANDVYRKCLELSLQTLFDISSGALSEVSMKKDEIYNVDFIKRIIKLETATLLKNSLLLGYYSNGGRNHFIEESFIEIGHACGYIFQVMNDLEPFCNSGKIIYHKGAINTDFANFKKNIAITFLYERMSSNEKRWLTSSDISNTLEFNRIIEKYFQKYEVIQAFMEEIAAIEVKINRYVNKVRKEGINELWCKNFNYFITLLVKVAQSRLE